MTHPTHARLTLDGASPYRTDPRLDVPPLRPREVPAGLVEVHVVSADGTPVSGRVTPAEAARLAAAARERRDRIRYAAMVGDPLADPAERLALARRIAESRPKAAWHYLQPIPSPAPTSASDLT